MSENKSWAIEVIEQAAMRRASEALTRQMAANNGLPDGWTVCGLSAKQVMRLADYYERHTGKLATEIQPNE